MYIEHAGLYFTVPPPPSLPLSLPTSPPIIQLFWRDPHVVSHHQRLPPVASTRHIDIQCSKVKTSLFHVCTLCSIEKYETESHFWVDINYVGIYYFWCFTGVAACMASHTLLYYILWIHILNWLETQLWTQEPIRTQTFTPYYSSHYERMEAYLNRQKKHFQKI